MKPVKVPVLDIRKLPTRKKHFTVFNAFDGLAAGESFQLVDDHDPASLHRKCQAERPGESDWNYVKNGPKVWRVKITRKAGHLSRPGLS